MRGGKRLIDEGKRGRWTLFATKIKASTRVDTKKKKKWADFLLPLEHLPTDTRGVEGRPQ